MELPAPPMVALHAWHEDGEEGFGVAGGAIDIGTASHVLAACPEEFAAAVSFCFANDTGAVSSPHPTALDL